MFDLKVLQGGKANLGKASNSSPESLKKSITQTQKRIDTINASFASYKDKATARKKYEEELGLLKEKLHKIEPKTVSIEDFNKDLRKIADAIENENIVISEIENDVKLTSDQKELAISKHRKIINGLIKNQEQLGLFSGSVVLFDEHNYDLLSQSSSPHGHAKILKDVNGGYYLSGHGCEYKTKVNNKEVVNHYIVDHEGQPVETGNYIKELILKGKIPPNTTLTVASCYISCLEDSTVYPNGVKVKKITQEEGVVVNTFISDTQDQNTSDSKVAIIGSRNADAA